MGAVVKSGLKLLRTVAGEQRYREMRSGLKGNYAARNYRALKGRVQKRYFDDNYALFWAGSHRDNRVGIYAYGSCDLPPIFAAIPSIQRVLDGTCCIMRDGLISYSRSDLLVQTLREQPQELVEEATRKLKLRPFYFQPKLFEPTFTVNSPLGNQEFPKNLVILSVAADVVRTVYKHRETGLLVDPGAWWLDQAQSMERVLKDKDTLNWFRKSFQSIGKIPVEEFADNFGQVVRQVKQRTGAPVMVLNLLTVEPSNLTHNYQYVKDPHSMRRREFNLALVELSQKLDFPILDVDRELKRTGLSETQMDFAHSPSEAYGPISSRAFGIMRELGVF
ncbi:MAG TPA: SGNH/GDSL hydrolase family protein [Dehalococcoidia bacterium]|nr:SGNH/GDSL hydrolase family protein [Dehalococcoidia bacterium]